MNTEKTITTTETANVPEQAAIKNPVKEFFARDIIKQKFNELLGKKSQAFLTSVLQITASNDMLSKCQPLSIFNAACVAATLDLPLNNNLGFAYIVPYRDKDKGQVAQFQLGYKGFIQLAQRSGQFKTIASAPIYEGQISEMNPLTGFVFDFSNKTSDTVIGYAAYFELLNGFQKTMYMTIEELQKHGTKYSQTFRKGFGLWKDDFDAMASKTVLKLLLSKFAPLSVEMLHLAIQTDQAVIKNEEGTQFEYVDHQDVTNEITVEDLKKLYSEKGELLPPDEAIHIERIINTEEKQSYKKAKLTLDKYL